MKTVHIRTGVIGQEQSRKNIKVWVILNILATKIADSNILLNMMIFHHRLPVLCGEWFLKERWWNVKLKILLKIFEVLHRDLKDIYYILISMNFIGERREDRIKQAVSDFDSRFTYAKADIEEEIAKQKEE